MSQIGKLKPLRDYSEHDVVNYFSFTGATGAKGMLVTTVKSGWNPRQSTYQVFQNDASLLPTTLASSPRYWIPSQVQSCPSGVKPFGMMLYDVLLQDPWGHLYRWDSVRKAEVEAVVSGEAVPVVRKGYFMMLLGTGGTGISPCSGGTNPSFLYPSNDGGGGYLVQPKQVYTISTGVGVGYQGDPVCGEVIGIQDAQGYALVYLNCYKV